MIPIEKCYQLRENVLVLIHMQTILAAKIQKSSPFTQKKHVTNYISIISKNAWRFLVDSNEQKPKMIKQYSRGRRGVKLI